MSGKPGFFGTFFLGLKVWAREMRRILATQAKRHEARQLKNRLREETELLHRLKNAPGAEQDLSRKQVEMLAAEIDRLEREEAGQTTKS